MNREHRRRLPKELLPCSKCKIQPSFFKNLESSNNNSTATTVYNNIIIEEYYLECDCGRVKIPYLKRWIDDLIKFWNETYGEKNERI